MSTPGQPVRKRQNRTNITRSRTGCHTCRRRRVKCDEGKPSCRACLRLDLTCDGYGNVVRYRFAEPRVLQPVPQPSDTAAAGSSVAGSSVAQEIDTSKAGPSERTSIERERRVSGASPAHDRDDRSHNGSDQSRGSGPSPIYNTPASYSTGGDGEFKISAVDYTLESGSARLDEYYFTQWTTVVSRIFPPVFSEMSSTMPEFMPFRHAILALSASHVAHTESHKSVGAADQISMYIPNSNHRYQSLRYYGKGVGELAQCVGADSIETLCYQVATSILFHHFEMNTGSLSGAVDHLENLGRLHGSPESHRKLESTRLGQKLLVAWRGVHSLIINKQGTVGTQRARSLAALTPNFLSPAVLEATTSYESIAQLVVESFMTTRTVIIDWFVCRAQSLTSPDQRHAAFGGLLKQLSLPDASKCLPFQLAETDDSYRRTLEQQRIKLDAWHSKLDITELPIESFTSTSIDSIRETDGNLEVEPLRFRTYEAAMTYAYYAAAQFSSADKTFDRMADLQNFDSSSGFSRDKFPWESVILRIASGLNPNDCLYKHTFQIGIVSFLIICATSCPHVSVVNWINAWIDRLEDHGMAVEDGMPLTLIKRVFRLITMMKRNGHDIYRLSIVDSDIREKWDFYRTDRNFVIAICGKDRVKGMLYNNVVNLPA
ncbi:hypothetical protein BJX63DRAFT_405816 [Aspergillus granulosus]|uniref:Zn(2)-C6 fungal-type domain-containing protein n=1 Tax=Aspergillus granulosus TaxID=176169 RepID=A0ABR4H1U5_9EURO